MYAAANGLPKTHSAVVAAVVRLDVLHNHGFVPDASTSTSHGPPSPQLSASIAYVRQQPVPPFTLVFPSVDTVLYSYLKAKGSGQLCLTNTQWKGDKFIRKAFRNYRPSNAARAGVTQHLKLMVPTRPLPADADISSTGVGSSSSAGVSGSSSSGGGTMVVVADWQLGGSFNISPWAWGDVQHIKSCTADALRCHNFELSFLLPPIVRVELPLPPVGSRAHAAVIEALRTGVLRSESGGSSTSSSSSASSSSSSSSSSAHAASGVPPLLPPELMAALVSQYPSLEPFKLAWATLPARSGPPWDVNAPYYNLSAGEKAWTTDAERPEAID